MSPSHSSAVKSEGTTTHPSRAYFLSLLGGEPHHLHVAGLRVFGSKHFSGNQLNLIKSKNGQVAVVNSIVEGVPMFKIPRHR